MVNNSRSGPRRVVPVPERCRSVHGVYTATEVGDDARIEAPPAVLLHHFGASEDALAALAERPHCRVVVSDAPVEDAADALLSSRREALAIAAEHDGVVVDLAVPRIVRQSLGQETLDVAAQWVALDLEESVLHSRGLEAFGLPELRLETGGPQHTGPPRVGMLLAIAMGLAHRLIAEWPANDPVGPAAVTLHDIALAFGDPDADSAPTEPALDLLIGHSDGHLQVTLLDDPDVLFAPGA